MSDLDPRFREDERHGDTPSGREASHADRKPSGSSSGGRDLWRASASFGWLIGSLLLLLLLGAAVVLVLVRLPSSPGGQRIAWIAVAAALLTLALGIAVLLRALPTMRYRFVGDALVVEWLGQQRVVPLAEITDIAFEPNEPLRLPRWEPFWPGYYVSTVRTPVGIWHTWATQQPRRRVRLTTAHGIVAISPERPVRFIAEIDRRRRAAGGPAFDAEINSEASAVWPDVMRQPAFEPTRDTLAGRSVPPGSEPASPEIAPRRRDRGGRDVVSPGRRVARNPAVAWFLAYRDLFRDRFLADQVASALVAVGVVLPVLMAAYLYSQYEGLPAQIPIQWDAVGDVSEQTSPSGLWRFPRIAVAILIINTALATLLIGIDRHLARLLVAAVPLTQIILFIALVRAVN